MTGHGKSPGSTARHDTRATGPVGDDCSLDVASVSRGAPRQGAVDGGLRVANAEIGKRVGMRRGSVLAWRSRFETDGVERIGKVAKGRGRKRSISEEVIEAVVHDTLHSTPPAETHWSCRSMAAHAGISKATVQKILVVVGYQAASRVHLQALDRPALRGEVGGRGRALPRPARAGRRPVRRPEEQIQALDRTQPSLPMTRGGAGP